MSVEQLFTAASLSAALAIAVLSLVRLRRERSNRARRALDEGSPDA